MEVSLSSFNRIFRPVSNPEIDWTLLLLHGTGGDETSLLEFGDMVGNGAAMLGVRGRSDEEGYPRFFRRLSEGVLDEEDIQIKAQELADWLQLTPRDNGYDPNRLIGMGYSNGANMAGAMLMLHPKTLAGGVLLRPMVPLQPIPAPDLTGKKVLILAGEQDHISPMQGAVQFGHMLADYGASVTTRIVNAGHGLTQDDVDQVRDFLLEF
ncbi:MAG: alpha/beta hydrolase [Fimbriimonadaceae bacterium]|nr:alpha/beta hydrolase [Fimbriimonadaceae bacterium]